MDRYHIYEAIGRGKHSVVYKGRRKKTIQHYAIKSVDKSQRPRVLQEVQVLRSLSHDLVLKFYAWYETQNHLWLILEYCVGGDLLALLRQDEHLPAKSIAAFGKDLAVALRILHRSGSLHCDLKPSNVLVDENGRLKLCGFGLARKIADVAAGEGGTPSQLSKRGTPCYMAPELFTERGVHSYASDLWALGCVLYECVSGKPPFVSNLLTELMEMILNDDPPRLDSGEHHPPTPALENLVAGLLEKDPAIRLDWDQTLAHPFWAESGGAALAEDLAGCAVTHPLPSQPAFDAFIAEEMSDKELSDKLASTRISPSKASTKSSTPPKAAYTSPRRANEADENASPGESIGGKRLGGRSSAKSREALRMSVNARANLEREEGGAYASRTPEKKVDGSHNKGGDSNDGSTPAGDPSPGPGAGDVELADTDAELNFADVDTETANDTTGDRSRPASADLRMDDEHATLSRVGSARQGGDTAAEDEEEEADDPGGRPSSAGGYAALGDTVKTPSTRSTDAPSRNRTPRSSRKVCTAAKYRQRSAGFARPSGTPRSFHKWYVDGCETLLRVP